MNWYVVKIIFSISSNETGRRAQFEEQLRLVKADSRCAAFEKAGRLGISIEEHFAKSKSTDLIFKFINVAEVNPVDNLEDGAELYTTLHEAENPDVYIGWANHKAALISFNN